MTNIEYVNDSFGTEHVVITNEDGSTVSMPKSVWDELQAKQNEEK